jgi:hypothetical protein
MENAVKYAVGRLIQLRMLIEGYFINQDIKYSIDVFEKNYNGYCDEYGWLSPGLIFLTGKGNFILTTRCVWGKLVSHNPNDTVRYMMEDVGLQGILSNNNDMIAYEAGARGEIIDKVLEICNSAKLPS